MIIAPRCERYRLDSVQDIPNLVGNSDYCESLGRLLKLIHEPHTEDVALALRKKGEPNPNGKRNGKEAPAEGARLTMGLVNQFGAPFLQAEARQ